MFISFLIYIQSKPCCRSILDKSHYHALLNKAAYNIKSAYKFEAHQNYEEAMLYYRNSVELLCYILEFETCNKRVKQNLLTTAYNMMQKEQSMSSMVRKSDVASKVKPNQPSSTARTASSPPKAVSNVLPSSNDAAADTSDDSCCDDDFDQGVSKHTETKQQRELRRSLEQTLIQPTNNVTWDSIIGLETAKQALKDGILPQLKCPDVFRQGYLKEKKGVLLYGPPGTGKSTLAKALANAAGNVTFMDISPSRLQGRYVGDSQNLCRILFEIAYERRPTILFFDEVEALMPARNDSSSGSSGQMTSELLQCITKTPGVFIVAATNCPWLMDTAFKRRFNDKIFVGLPTPEQRVQVLKHHIGKYPTWLTNSDMQRMTSSMKDYSGDDIEKFSTALTSYAFKRAEQAKYFRWIPALDKWMPCTSKSKNATKMRMTDIPFENILLTPVSWKDYLHVKETFTPNIIDAEYKKQLEKFQTEWGHKK